MNKRRNVHSSFGFIHAVVLVLSAVVLASGGIMHAYAKNRQVEVTREMDATRGRIDETNEAIKMVQVKIDRKLNRHIIRAALAERGSDLSAIPSQAVEVISPNTSNAKTVAKTNPN